MNHVAAAFAAVAVTASISGQDPGSSRPDAPPAPTTREAPGSEVGELIEQLGAERYEERQAAEKALQRMGGSAAKALAEAAESHPDMEVRTRARRLLQRAEPEGSRSRGSSGAEPGGADGGLRRRSDPGAGEPGMERGAPSDGGRPPLDALDEAMRGLGPEVTDLRRQIEEMRRQLEQGLPMSGLQIRGLEGLPGNSSGTSLSIGPDGVRLELRETGEDGKSESKVYEAPDLETLRREHPEIADRVPDSSGRSVGGLPGFLMPEPLPLGGRSPRGFEGLEAPPGPGEVLGVRVEVLDSAVSDYLRLAPGVGLLVREVEDGSLAAAAQLEAHDVILEIGGRPIRTVPDVRVALRGIAKGEVVEVVVNRFGRTLRLETEKRIDATARPEVEVADEADPQPGSRPTPEPGGESQEATGQDPAPTRGGLRRRR